MGNLNNGTLERNDSRRVALVTGGSRGIGRACAVGLAEDGFDIAVVYAGSVDAARETCEACEAAGATARAYQCDVADPAAVNACVEATLAPFGRSSTTPASPAMACSCAWAMTPSIACSMSISREHST